MNAEPVEPTDDELNLDCDLQALSELKSAMMDSCEPIKAWFKTWTRIQKKMGGSEVVRFEGSDDRILEQATKFWGGLQDFVNVAHDNSLSENCIKKEHETFDLKENSHD